MNRKQKKVLMITLFIFAALCVTVPKQKYVSNNEAMISLDSQLYKETGRFNKNLTAMVVKTHYDYNYLITWSLCLCGLSGILLLYFKDKKQQTETQKEEKNKKKDLLKKIDMTDWNIRDLSDNQNKKQKKQKDETEKKRKFSFKRIFFTVGISDNPKPFDMHNIEQNKREVYNFSKAKNKKLTFDYTAFYNELSNGRYNYHLLYNSLEKHNYPVPENLNDFKKGLGREEKYIPFDLTAIEDIKTYNIFRDGDFLQQYCF